MGLQAETIWAIEEGVGLPVNAWFEENNVLCTERGYCDKYGTEISAEEISSAASSILVEGIYWSSTDASDHKTWRFELKGERWNEFH